MTWASVWPGSRPVRPTRPAHANGTYSAWLSRISQRAGSSPERCRMTVLEIAPAARKTRSKCSRTVVRPASSVASTVTPSPVSRRRSTCRPGRYSTRTPTAQRGDRLRPAVDVTVGAAVEAVAAVDAPLPGRRVPDPDRQPGRPEHVPRRPERGGVAGQAGEQLLAGPRPRERPVGVSVERISPRELVVLGREREQLQGRAVAARELRRGDRPAAEVVLGVGQQPRPPDVAEAARGVGGPGTDAVGDLQGQDAVVSEGDVGPEQLLVVGPALLLARERGQREVLRAPLARRRARHPLPCRLALRARA